MRAPKYKPKRLQQGQIEAAKMYWGDTWIGEEIKQLKKAFPNSLEAIRIKAIVLNTLYGTNVIAITKVADCVHQVLSRPNHLTGVDLIEELVDEIRKVTNKTNYSFASKYAHFFIDSSIPILDWFAEFMLGRHLDDEMRSKANTRYRKFAEDIEALKRVSALNCDCAELDSYLWVAGEYWYWKDHPTYGINGDLRLSFENLDKDTARESPLSVLLGLNSNGLSGGLNSSNYEICN